MDEKVFVLLEKLALKLNTNAEHLWEVLTNQAIIHSLSYIIPVSFFIIISFFITIISGIKIKGWDEDIDFSIYNVLFLVFLVILGISCFACAYNFKDVLVFLNPEYYAFQEIKSLLN